MRQNRYTLKTKRPLTTDVWELKFFAPKGEKNGAGQFVALKIEGFSLRRPISVCDVGRNEVTLVVKMAGEGTEKLCAAGPGEEFDVLDMLGNGYDILEHGRAPLLIGGGAGVPPLALLAKKLINAGITPMAALGFNSSAEAFYYNEGPFLELGITPLVATVDGSLGEKGFVTELAAGYAPERDYVFCCGPEPMLRAVYGMKQFTGGQYSFEERMGCGFGACMGCSHETVTGYKRICRDGPVLRKEEILWRT